MAQFVKNQKIEDDFNQSIEFIEKDYPLYTEKLLLDFREVLSERINKSGISRAKLATMLGCSKSYITQLLDGTANIRLGTLVKVLFSLGVKPIINYEYEDIEALKFFKKNTVIEMEFKETSKTITLENKINQQEYERA